MQIEDAALEGHNDQIVKIKPLPSTIKKLILETQQTFLLIFWAYLHTVLPI